MSFDVSTTSPVANTEEYENQAYFFWRQVDEEEDEGEGEKDDQDTIASDEPSKEPSKESAEGSSDESTEGGGLSGENEMATPVTVHWEDSTT